MRPPYPFMRAIVPAGRAARKRIPSRLTAPSVHVSATRPARRDASSEGFARAILLLGEVRKGAKPPSSPLVDAQRLEILLGRVGQLGLDALAREELLVHDHRRIVLLERAEGLPRAQERPARHGQVRC